MHTKTKKMPLWAIFTADILALGIFLCTFSLFHHVLPKVGDQHGIHIDNPYDTQSESTSTDGTAESTDPKEEPDWYSLFTASPTFTDNSYSDSGCYLCFNEYSYGNGNDKVTYYVTEVYVKDVTRIRTAFADDTYGQGIYERIKSMAKRHGAIFATSGDYYGSNETGPVIRNGTIYRAEDTGSDICVLFYDGTMEMYLKGQYDIDELIEKGAWQSWKFGPALVDKGTPFAKFNTTSYLTQVHPRAGIGYYEPGHYCFVTVDGRQDHSVGVDLKDFAKIFTSLGCTMAYNLDGGRSACCIFRGEYINSPYKDGRSICDMIFIGGE